MKIVAIINQKGGVGKSTTAHSIASGFALAGKKVLLVDLDAQGNLSYVCDINTKGNGALGVLLSPETAPDEIQHTRLLDIIPSSVALASADATITSTGKEYRLREALEPLKSKYDVCIIDTPPALGIVTINALTACDGVIIPAQADAYSLQGIVQLYHTLQAVVKYCNNTLKVYGIVLTRYNNRTVIRREVAETLDKTAQHIQTKLYKTKIRECTALVEAQAVKQDIYSYAPSSNATKDYRALLAEVAKDLSLKGVK